MDNLQNLHTKNINQSTIISLEQYFNKIGGGSIISYNDILRNTKQKLAIDDIINELLTMSVIIQYNGDDYAEEDGEECLYKLSNAFRFSPIEDKKGQPKFIHSADLLRTISQLKKKYTVENKTEIDALISNFIGLAENID